MKLSKLTILALALGLVLGDLDSAQAADKPNVVIMLADNLGYGDIGPVDRDLAWIAPGGLAVVCDSAELIPEECQHQFAALQKRDANMSDALHPRAEGLEQKGD